jgi:hypothetical protein
VRTAFVTATALIVCLGGSLQGQSADERSLQVTHETLVSGVKSGNVVMVQALIHPRALGFFRDSTRLVQLGGEYSAADAVPTLLADLGRFVATPTETVYRVVGTTGVVLMSTTFRAKKGEKEPDRYVRATYVYLPDGANWKLMSWHTSDVPLVKK